MRTARGATTASELALPNPHGQLRDARVEPDSWRFAISRVALQLSCLIAFVCARLVACVFVVCRQCALSTCIVPFQFLCALFNLFVNTTFTNCEHNIHGGGRLKVLWVHFGVRLHIVVGVRLGEVFEMFLGTFRGDVIVRMFRLEILCGHVLGCRVCDRCLGGMFDGYRLAD